MANSAFVKADSISPRGCRLTTIEVTIPRFVQAEFNTHGMLARNSGSSRALPVRKSMKAIVEDMFVPVQFGTAVSSMNAGPPLTGEADAVARGLWIDAAEAMLWHAMMLTTSPQTIKDEWASGTYATIGDLAMSIAERLDAEDEALFAQGMLKVSKGLTNRLLEPFAWQTIIVTATEWDNFFALRTDSNAQEEIRTPAQMMLDAYNASTPVLVEEGGWHLPMIRENELDWALENPLIARKVATARCARVSYLTHDKGGKTIDDDVAFADRLARDGHMSPFEHSATPITENEQFVREGMAQFARQNSHLLSEEGLEELVYMMMFSAKFNGWTQFRREQKNQRVFVKPEPELSAV